VHLPPGTKVKAISAGLAHGLALTTDGKVLAWGDNNQGQLGNGTSMPADVPVPVELPPGSTVTAIAAGNDHSSAITSTGQVLTWGANGSGQLGDGSTQFSSVPVRASLPPGTRVRGLFAGCADTVALTAAGKVLAWGDNSSGQIGDGAGERFRRLPVRVRLPAGVKVSAVASGPVATFSLAIG
jgi:alpha-tubulin suppressor-like RCC1 family protein